MAEMSEERLKEIEEYWACHPGVPELVSEVRKLQAQVVKHREEITNDACGDALDRLWKDIIIARSPTYGDWEYPGQAYRHLKAEFEDLRKDRDRLQAISDEFDAHVKTCNSDRERQRA